MKQARNSAFSDHGSTRVASRNGSTGAPQTFLLPLFAVREVLIQCVAPTSKLIAASPRKRNLTTAWCWCWRTNAPEQPGDGSGENAHHLIRLVPKASR